MDMRGIAPDSVRKKKESQLRSLIRRRTEYRNSLTVKLVGHRYLFLSMSEIVARWWRVTMTGTYPGNFASSRVDSFCRSTTSFFLRKSVIVPGMFFCLEFGKNRYAGRPSVRTGSLCNQPGLHGRGRIHAHVGPGGGNGWNLPAHPTFVMGTCGCTGHGSYFRQGIRDSARSVSLLVLGLACQHESNMGLFTS